MPYPKQITASKAVLEEMYHGQQMSQREIAEVFGVHQASMWAEFKKFGIVSRPVGSHDPTKRKGYKDGSQSRLYRALIEKEKCDQCGQTDNLVIHHRDLDHFNNSLTNLQILCLHCHLSLHKKLNHQGIKSNSPIGWTRNGTTPGQIGNLKDR